MARKVRTFVCGVFLYGNHLLLLREIGANGLPKSGFHLPGGEILNGEQPDAHLLNCLKVKYRADVEIVKELTPLVVSLPGQDVVLYPFYCKDLNHFYYPKNMEHKYIAFKELDDVYVDPIDKFLAQKVGYYAQYIRGIKAKAGTGLSRQELNYMNGCLKYFSKRLPRAEIIDFKGLLKCEITKKEAIDAFKWLLRTYGLDFAEYLDLLIYLQKAERK